MITDSAGVALITSDGPEGNIGCPLSESEIAWFMQMIRKTARSLGEAEIKRIEAALGSYAKAQGR